MVLRTLGRRVAAGIGASAILFSMPLSAFAAASVTTPANQDISSATAGGTYTTLTGPALSEGAVADIGVGTIVLAAPSGFEFDTSATVTVLVTRTNGTGANSRNINGLASGSSISASVPDSTHISVTITSATNNGVRNRLTWQGIKVRPTANTVTSGNITKDASSTSVITGVTNGTTNFGTLNEINPPSAPGTPNLTNASDTGTSNTDDITSDNTPSFTVSCTTGNTVTLYDGVTVLDTASCAGSNANLTSSSLADGNHTITASQTSTVESAQSSGLLVVIDTSEVAPGTPDLDAASDSGDSNTDNDTNDDTPTFTISCTSGDTVELRNSNTTVASGTCVGGTISLTSSALSDGGKTIRARQIDTAGNTSANSSNLSVTIDTAAPGAPNAPNLEPTSDSGTSNTDNITNDTTPTFDIGGCTNGNMLKLYDGVTFLGSVGCAGGAELITSSVLADGTYSLTAREYDVAGNESNASSGLSVTIDSTEAVTGAPDLQSGSDSGSSNTDNVTTDTTPTVDISCITGDTVSLYNGVTSLGVGTCVASSVTITSSALAAGSYTLTAKQADAAGNESSASSALSLVIDLTAPTIVLTGSTPVDTQIGQAYVDAGATASDAVDGDITANIVTVNPVVNTTLGAYMITYNVSDAAGNAALQVTRVVNVIQATTTTTVLADVNPSTYGDNVTFTATITGAYLPTGTVQFYNGLVAMGTPQTVSGGQAQLVWNDLIVGTHNITAEYSGDSNNLTSTSAIYAQTVDQKSVTITPDASQTKIYGDADPSFTYTNTALAFADTLSGSLARVAGENVGTYAFTLGTLTAGSNYSLSLDSETFEITQKSVTVTPDASQSKVFGSSDPTLTYTSTPLAFSDTFSGSLSRDAGENVGTYNITIGTLSAGSNYSVSLDAETFEITQAATTTSTVLDTPTPNSTVGDSVILNATVTGVSPTGTVSFYSGATLIGTGTLSNGSGTYTHIFTQAGNYDLTAAYGGDSNHTGSTSASLIVHIVDKDSPDTVTNISSSGSSLVGSSVDFTATVNGAYNPTGTVEFYDGAVLIGTGSLNGSFEATVSHTFILAGNHDITAHYLGDSNNNPSQSIITVEIVLTQEVRKDTPATSTVLSVTNPSTIGDTVVMTADVTGGYGPTGDVYFYDGAVFLGSGSLVAGTATFSTDQLAVGSHDLTAEYQGDVNNNSSMSAMVTAQVVQQMTSVTILGNIPTPVNAPASVTFQVTVNGYFPTGTVTISDGPSDILTIPLSHGSGSFTQIFTGAQTSHIFVATYPGDVNNTASVSPNVTVLVAAPSEQVAGSQSQGGGSNRGNNLSRANSIAQFLANVHLGNLAPGSFGGADAPLAGEEKQYICALQRSLPRLYTSNYVKALAEIVSHYTGRSADVIAGWLRDPSVCADITSQRLGGATVSQVTLTPFFVTSEGFPLSGNPTWNKCVTGKFTYEDIQSNPDRDNKGTPRSCADYHTGSSWYHPDFHMFFDWNLATKKLTLPAGYVIQKEEAVSVR